MKAFPSFALLLLALAQVLACSNQPLPAGDGGASAGSSGGSGGSGGSAGAGDVPLRDGCNVMQLVQTKYSCTLVGACHDAQGSAAGLDLTTPGWDRRLVGASPKTTSQAAFPSLCAGQGRVYLVPGSQPAVGLFLDKLKPNPPCGGREPLLGSFVTPEDLDCFQRWANVLTTP